MNLLPVQSLLVRWRTVEKSPVVIMPNQAGTEGFEPIADKVQPQHWNHRLSLCNREGK